MTATQILAEMAALHNAVLAMQLTEESTAEEITQAQVDYYNTRMRMFSLMRQLLLLIPGNE